MSAPAGWHLQPDGQERYWDGQQWTEHFRMPLALDPTAPPEWAPAAQDTQVLDVSHTTAIPAADPLSDPYAATGEASPYPPARAGSAAPESGYGAVPPGYPATPSGYPTGQPGYPAGQPGYPPGQPGYPAYGQPPPQRGNGAAKGCLIAALLGLFVLALVVAGAIFFFARTVDRVTETFPTSFPSDFPSDFPTEDPGDGGTAEVEVTVGGGFELPRGRIERGWRIGSDGAGPLSFMTIEGMRAVPLEDEGLPLVFTMSFEVDDTTTVETVCTSPGGTAGTAVDVSCVPLFGDVEGARRVTVTPAF